MKPQLVINKHTGLIVQTDEDWHLINFNGFFSGTVMFVPEGRTDIKVGHYANDFIIEKFVPYSGDVDIPIKTYKIKDVECYTVDFSKEEACVTLLLSKSGANRITVEEVAIPANRFALRKVFKSFDELSDFNLNNQ